MLTSDHSPGKKNLITLVELTFTSIQITMCIQGLKKKIKITVKRAHN